MYFLKRKELQLIKMRILAITKKVLKELIRDKQTLALMFLAPILVMWLMNVMFSANSQTTVTIATVGVNKEIRQKLADVKGVTVKNYAQKKTAQNKLKNHKIDGMIVLNGKDYQVTHANTDSGKTALTKQALKVALNQTTMTNLQVNLAKTPLGMKIAKTIYSPKVSNYYQYGDSQTGFFAKIVPILMGFFVFFFVFLISGMALLKERTSGTLDRLLATPVKRSEIVLGYLISYGILAIIQAAVIVLATIWLLKVEVVGSIAAVIAISFLLALVALAFGILMSTIAASEFQMMQFIPLVVVPQIFFSGIIPLDSMAPWVRYIGKILPLTYTGDALNQIVMNGTSIWNLGGDILALLIFLVVLLELNIIGLKRYRQV